MADFPVLRESGFDPTEAVLATPSVKINGVEFKVSSIVCIDSGRNHPESYPSFSQIKTIFFFEDSRVCFEVACFTTMLKDITLNAYCVEKDYAERVVMPSSKLAYYKPLSVWVTPVSNCQYISVRHLII